jgi:phage terminase large subunit-like protein
MPIKNYIYEYYQAIKDERVVVGQWIKMLYEFLIEGLEKKYFYFDQKKANKAIKFIENYCHHCKGRSDHLSLELWQKALISAMFGIVDEKGLRQFREVVLIVARKNGKSLLAASIIAYMSYLDGEYGPEVYCIAPKVEQADIVYSSFWQMTQLEQELKERIKSRKGDLYIAETNAIIRKIAFSAKKSDGFNPHLVICDEIAAWVGDQGKKVYEVMKSSLGARQQPMLLSCSTSGYVNEGIFDELFMRGTKLLLGDSKESRLLPVFYTIDDVDKWNDLNELAKSNPNLGVSVSVDYMLEEIAVAEGSLSKKSEFITKYCNMKQNSSSAWLPVKSVETASSKDNLSFEKFKSHYCVAGIDLSQTTDLTSACLLIEDKKELYVISHFWLPAEKLSEAITRDGIPYDEMIQKGFLSLAGDNFIDYHAVFDWIAEAVEKYELLPLMIGYDRYSAQYLIQDLKNYGFQVDDVYQGHNLTPVLFEMEGLLKDGKVHIGDNTLLKIHLLDSALEHDSRTQKIRLKKVSPRSHIDGTAALADAFCVRQKWMSELGDRLKN